MVTVPPSSQLRNWIRYRYRRDDRGVSKVLVAVIVGAALMMLAPLMLFPMFFAVGPAHLLSILGGNQNGDCNTGGQQPGQSSTAKGDIPASYLKLYKAAGKKFGVQWNVIAGIGKEETNHGRSTLQGVHSGANNKGAGGPMQFLQATFNEYAVDGNHDGKKDRYDPEDAIPTTAHMLKANGAPGNLWKAIWAYNHASFYVNAVLNYAKHYASGDFTIQNDAPAPDCADMNLPANSSAAVKAVIEFAQKQLGKDYVYGAVGPDTFDCSGLTMAAYRSIGVNLPRTSQQQWVWDPKIRVKKGKEQPGDLVFFAGSDGTMTSPGHIGLVIGGGKMIEAPHTGAVVRISSYKRPDLVGFTRPLAHKGVKPTLP